MWRGRSPSSCCDVLLGFYTNKVVWVRDRRLGILNFLFAALILSYIGIYQIVYNSAYLKKEVPLGTAHLELQRPTNGCDPDSNGVEELLVTTRVRRQTQTRHCSPDPRDEGLEKCERPYWTETTEDFFIADIESFFLAIAHSAVAPTLGIRENLKTSSGVLEVCSSSDPEAKETSTYSCTTLRPGQGYYSGHEDQPVDIFAVSDLLEVAGINLDNITSETGGRTKRFDGVVLMVTELPTRTFGLSEIKFSNVSIGGSVRVVENRQGILIVVKQEFGKVGQLARSCLPGACLQTLVDYLANYLLPDKRLFTEYKYQTTHDFGPFRKLLRRALDAGVSALEILEVADEIEEAKYRGEQVDEKKFAVKIEELIRTRQNQLEVSPKTGGDFVYDLEHMGEALQNAQPYGGQTGELEEKNAEAQPAPASAPPPAALERNEAPHLEPQPTYTREQEHSEPVDQHSHRHSESVALAAPTPAGRRGSDKVDAEPYVGLEVHEGVNQRKRRSSH
uniref:Uncharacterized protein n=1 Tax=Chromera velia CCMP2878 TaxID=1169474 RepID=A0A0G4I5D3_9ALVE|eukprot:Cvel_11146.t1-p1 / transcript=Cvel_11146.t1 / gene=Cvel_11146 / organism=Chromera_velia_CCMP2878 / gene_product=P2X receptor D, putative / transcript_product=P2X receptor D, putative / location=Cvel_scaffold691:27854-40465(-) / protein_length=504 / sequence_SO=supercontig / SO=protein_coding / is_pseudo=false